MKKMKNGRDSEFGGAGAQFLIILVVIVLLANAGYQWLPVAYGGETVKQEMHTAVVQGMALPGTAGNPVDVTKKRLGAIIAANQLPPDTIVEVRQLNNSLQARIAYKKQVSILPFGIFTYTYEFDHTASPSGFLSKQ